MNQRHLKQVLLSHCENHLTSRRASVQRVLDNVAISLREETKSSAGDKHETGRAMLQLEREQAGKQLATIEILEGMFHRIGTEVSKGPAHLGSIVETPGACYYISIPVGKIIIEDKPYYAIGVRSPIGGLLMGKMVGDVICFRESEIKITDIY